MSAFELLLRQRYNTYRASSKLVQSAGASGALPELFSQERHALNAEYWNSPVGLSGDRKVKIPGTRGGLLWRYVIAMGAWVSLLDRVNNLLGPDACRTVQELGGTPDGPNAPGGDRGISVIQNALLSSGFRDYMRARDGDGLAFHSLQQHLSELRSPSPELPAAAVIDLLTHFVVQDFELADVAYLPKAWASVRSLDTDAGREETLHDAAYDADSALRALSDISRSVASQRQGLRNLAQQALESDGRLKSLFLSRVLPFAESHFFIAGKHAVREPATASFAFSAIEQDYLSRQHVHLESSRMDMPRADPWVDNTAELLSRVSVPFLYWCAKSHIPLAQLWSCDADTISLWPHSRFSSQAKVHVAFTSMVEKRSFRGAMQFLVTALQDCRGATCLLVTDHWNEEEAVAAYQVMPNGAPSGSIAVLRSDGPRYPISVFEFPAQ